jgi:hypothetical protein
LLVPQSLLLLLLLLLLTCHVPSIQSVVGTAVC